MQKRIVIRLIARKILYFNKMSIANTFNPSDYQYLIKSLIDANYIAKSEALKRFNVLVLNDKKQFAIYSKRIVMALQDLMHEQKEDINLLAAMLVHEIISLNPKDVQYYVRTKLLKFVVANLGDSKPALRKTSHYCLLAYVRTMKNFDQLISLYLQNGLNSNQPQLKQKCINSMQSLILTETKYLNWQSNQFKKMFQMLLLKLKDQSSFVQKASEQCLLTLSRMEDIKSFIKKLSSSNYTIYKSFCEDQKQLGIVFEQKQKQSHRNNHVLNRTTSSHNSQKVHNTQSQINLDKVQVVRQDSYNKQAIIDRIEEIRRNSQTPKIEEEALKNILPKKIQNRIPSPQRVKQKSWKQSILVKEKQVEKVKEKQKIKQQPIPLKLHPLIFMAKTQKIENVFGKKLLQDLRNDKDWKIRLEAVEQLQTKFQIYKAGFEVESIMKNIVPILMKLLADQNFKIAFISLKVIEEILKLPDVNIQSIVPQVLEKLNDNKIALRQNVSKLIRREILLTGNPLWIDGLLDQLKKNSSSHLRQEVLNILTLLYEEKDIQYSAQKIVEQICPLMDDPKTKIKIKTLDLLVIVTIKARKNDQIKNMLISRMNQVYFEMYLEKISKEVKNMKIYEQTEAAPQEKEKSLSFPSLRKAKISANNTTSSTLQKYSKTLDIKNQSRASKLCRSKFIQETSSQAPRKNQKPEKTQKIEIFSIKKSTYQDIYDEKLSINKQFTNTIRKKSNTNFKKKLQKTLESKLTVNYSLDQDTLKPFSDPDRELKSIINDLKSDDWQIAFDSINKLRRIIAHHDSLLNSIVIKLVVGDLMRHVESLRSSLSKNAVIALNELSNSKKSLLDSQVDLIFTKLIKKTLDTNSFISQQVRKALISVSTYCNQTKVLTMIWNFHSSKSLAIKQNLLCVMEEILYIQRFYNREIERIVQILVDFLAEGALQIREKTKPLLSYIVNKQAVNSKAYRLIPPDFIQKYKKIQINKQMTEPVNVSPKRQKQSDLGDLIERSSTRKKKKILIFPEQFNDFQELIKKCQGSDWKVRQQSLNQMVSLMRKYAQQVSQFKLAAKMIDIISKHTSDPNLKVSLNAFKLFKSLIPLIPKLIETNLSVVINQLFNTFCSQKNQVRQSSLETFDIIAQNIEKWMLIQHLCNGTLYGPIKSKASILIKILKILPESFKEKKQVLKNIYGLINKLCDDNRHQIIPILKELILLVLSLGGDDALAALKQQAKGLIYE